MNALNFLTNAERAKIIHQLFPDEMPGLIEFSLRHATQVIEAAEELKQTWNNGFMTAEYWIYLASCARTVIEAKNKQLAKNSRLFADQLFFGELALFMADSIGQHARFSCNAKFKAAAQLFFEFMPDEAGYAEMLFQLCLSQTAGFLFDAINEAMAQDDKPGIGEAAREHISHHGLASLAAQIVRQTDHVDGGGHWVDKAGKFKISHD